MKLVGFIVMGILLALTVTGLAILVKDNDRVNKTVVDFTTTQGEVNEDEARRAIDAIEVGNDIEYSDDAEHDLRMQQYWKSAGSENGSSPTYDTKSMQDNGRTNYLKRRFNKDSKVETSTTMQKENILQREIARLLSDEEKAKRKIIADRQQRLQAEKLIQNKIKILKSKMSCETIDIYDEQTTNLIGVECVK